MGELYDVGGESFEENWLLLVNYKVFVYFEYVGENCYNETSLYV